MYKTPISDELLIEDVVFDVVDVCVVVVVVLVLVVVKLVVLAEVLVTDVLKNDMFVVLDAFNDVFMCVDMLIHLRVFSFLADMQVTSVASVSSVTWINSMMCLCS